VDLSKIRVEPPKRELEKFARKRLDNLTKPKGSLGRLEDLAVRLVSIYGEPFPKINKKLSLVFAGDHGVTAEGVSAFPKEVTRQMVYNFLIGKAAINVLARHAGSVVKVIDVGVDYDFPNAEGLIIRKVVKGTRNFAIEPAMTRNEAIRTIEAGYEVTKEFIKEGFNMVGIGDMGIGNTTASSAITSVIVGIDPALVTGRGTGIDDTKLEKKIAVIRKAIELHKPNPNDPIDVLAKVGGAEIGAVAGAILACSEAKIPVILDGFNTTSGALIAYKINLLTREYTIASHLSEEIGHKVQLEYLGLEPILNLGMRLGEGTGAALAMTILEASLKIYSEMATFEEVGVSRGTY